MASSPTKEVFNDLEAKFDALGIRPGSPSKTSSEKLQPGQIRKQPMIPDPESRPLHPKLTNFDKYISERWHDSDNTPLDPRTATQTDLNDRVICLLNRYLEDEISNNILHRRVCEDFEMWDRAIWDRVHKEVRIKLRNTLRDNGVHVPRHEMVSGSLASLVQQGYQTSGETESEASFPNTINKGKQPVDPIDDRKQLEALDKRIDALFLGARLDPNHPSQLGQQFDDSGNSVHTDKASSLTRAHRYYQAGQHNNTATAGP
ncbi:hypothetical protein E4U51_004284, partial [Claviceps purpurea]